jgi:murein DD-endopeptidase MepM/ murein hydrolase activator NlpD
MRSVLRQFPRPLRQWLTGYLQLPLWLTGLVALILVSSAIGLLNAPPTTAQLPPILNQSPSLVSPSLVSPSLVSASSVSVSPSRPVLGDTIAITIPGAGLTQTPSLTWNGKTYALFPLPDGRYRALIPTTPRDRPGQVSLQVNAGTPQVITLTLGKRDFPVQRIWLPAGQDGSVSDTEYDRVNAFKQTVSPEKLWNGKLLRPNDGPVTSVYGVRRYYNGVFAEDYFHRGVDYGGNVGSAIVAPANARVVFVGYERDGFPVHGNCIGLDHGQGVTSIYIHLTSIKVQVGDSVQAGQTIGTLGSTGSATGPHLHWGLFVQGEAVDPVPWREAGFE